MITERIYFEDAYRTRFEAEVLHVRGLTAILQRSAFYPEGGGQPADAGALHIGAAVARVLDVQVGEDGTVRHTLDHVPDELRTGVVVSGVIDSSRRREYSALHTAQHALSRALELEADAITVSARLSGSGATIDVARAEIPETLLERAESLARSVTNDDVLVRSWFPSASELASLPLRRVPKVEENIRVVAIGDFDFTPCGGTHTARSSALSPIAIIATERHKGLTRITFTAGPRGQRELGEVLRASQRTASGLKTSLPDLDGAVQRMRAELETVRGERGDLRATIASVIANSIDTSTERAVLCVVRDDLDAGLVRDLAARVKGALPASSPVRLVIGLGAPEPTGRPIAVFRAANSNIDAGKLLRALTSDLGGKGGGRPDFAEGRVPATISCADLEHLTDRLLSAL